MTLDELKRLVTAEGVKRALEPQLFMSLTGAIDINHSPSPRTNSQHSYDKFDELDDFGFTPSTTQAITPPVTQDYPTILLTACSNAATWGYITLVQAQKLNEAYSEDQLDVMSTALINRAIYELGRASLFDVSFQTNKKDAQILLNTIIGLTPTESGQTSHFTGASITKDEKSRSQNLNPLYRFSQRQPW